MTVSAASASAAVAADEIIVGTTLGATTYRLANFSKTINLATTGINAMDTGTAPVSGWVAVYAIYNPTTSVSALLGVASPNTFMPTIYGGANMPSGYTTSALLTVVPTNASSQFKICSVRGRKIGIQLAQAYTVTGSVSNQVVTPITVIPANAIEAFGELQVGSTGASALTLAVFSDTANINQQILSISVGTGQSVASNFSGLMITTKQQFVATSSSTGGSPTFTVYFSGYSI
ncbi:hypothetical protein BMS17_03935 [Pseudomonas sp. C9]|nr:hypothetical protein BMS17_03935 [Pseudomonas sp. C9]